MTHSSEEGRAESELTSRSIIMNWAIVSIFLVVVFVMTGPISSLLGGSEYAAVSVGHGIFATLGVVVGTVTAYLGWRLYIGQIKAYRDLKILSLFCTIVAAAAIIFGNWLYIAYRGPGGPRAFFLEKIPEVHEVFFEFKEFIALFPFPLAVAATYIIWKYSDTLPNDKPLRTSLAVMFAIAWVSLMIAFLLGAAITKLRSA